MENVPTSDIWLEDSEGKGLQRSKGLLVFNEETGKAIAEKADERITSGDLAGLLSFDPVKGAPFVLPRSAEVFPDGWDYSESERGDVATFLDELCREDVAEVSALFEPHHQSKLWSTSGRADVSRYVWKRGPVGRAPGNERKQARFKKARLDRLKEVGLHRLTPRTKESTRAAILIWIADDALYQAYLREIGNKRFDNNGKLTERADPNRLPPTLPTPRPITQDPGSWGFGNVGLGLDRG